MANQIARKVVLTNVRLAGNSLFTATAFEKDKPAKYSARLIVSKNDKDNGAKLQKAIADAAKAKWGAEAENALRWCKANGVAVIHDGEKQIGKAGFDDKVVYFNASNDARPKIVDRDPNRDLTADDGVLYPGCYVNVSLSIFAGEHPKGVQFVKDGESLSNREVATADDFPNLEGEADPGADWGGDEADPFA